MAKRIWRMSGRVAFFVVALLAFVATSRSAAVPLSQVSELETLSNQIRASLETQQPEFTIERAVVSEGYVIQRWLHYAERVVITLREEPSYAQAVQALNMIPGTLAGSVAPTPLPPGLAADGFMYLRYGPGGTSTLYFVKGQRVVSVTGPSEQIAVWFAFKVAEQLPT